MSIELQAVFDGKQGEQKYVGVTLSKMRGRGEWSTHIAASNTPKFTEADRFWGHYTSNLAEALQDFTDRVKQMMKDGYKMVEE